MGVDFFCAIDDGFCYALQCTNNISRVNVRPWGTVIPGEVVWYQAKRNEILWEPGERPLPDPCLVSVLNIWSSSEAALDG